MEAEEESFATKPVRHGADQLKAVGHQGAAYT